MTDLTGGWRGGLNVIPGNMDVKIANLQNKELDEFGLYVEPNRSTGVNYLRTRQLSDNLNCTGGL